MFDDHTGRGIKGLHTFPGGVGVGNVVEAQLFALQLCPARQQTGCGLRFTIKGRALVRVFAVAQGLHLVQLQGEHVREFLALRHAGWLGFNAFMQGAQVAGDHAVVGGSVRKHLFGQAKFGCTFDMTRTQFCQHLGVVGRVDHHGHVGPVFGSGAQHGRAADVNVLDGHFQRAVGTRRGLRKGVEVDHQQVNGVDAVFGQRCHVLGHITPRQQTTMDARVQGLDAAVQHLREAGHLRHFGDGQTRVGQQPRRATCRQERDVQSMQGLCKFDDAGFVRNREQGGGHGLEINDSFDKVVIDQLAPQCVAVDAQPLRGLALVVLTALHHHLEQGLFNGGHHQFVQAVGLCAAQVAKVLVQAQPDAIFYVLLAHGRALVTSLVFSLVLAPAFVLPCCLRPWPSWPRPHVRHWQPAPAHLVATKRAGRPVRQKSG